MEAASASCGFGFTITWRKCSARMRESTQTTLSGSAAAQFGEGVPHRGRNHAAVLRLRLVGHDDDIEGRPALRNCADQLPRRSAGSGAVLTKSTRGWSSSPLVC